MFVDWEVIRQAFLLLIHGQNPYSPVFGNEMLFFNPWWTLIILSPLLALPSGVGVVLNIIISFLVFIPITKKFGISKLGCLLLLTSPMYLDGLQYGAIEWLPFCGVFFSPPIALIFYLIKPQATVGLIIFTLYEEYESGDSRKVFQMLLPSVFLLAIQLYLWGIPSLPSGTNPGRLEFFPMSLIIGMPLLISSIYHRKNTLATVSSPFLSPYLTFHGYLPILLTENIQISACLWLLSWWFMAHVWF